MKTYHREKLTGKTSYREGIFGGLILTVEVKEQASHGALFYGLMPMSPPPDYTDEQKAIWNHEQYVKTESNWTTVRTFYRDAKKADMISLEHLKKQGEEHAIQQSNATP